VSNHALKVIGKRLQLATPNSTHIMAIPRHCFDLDVRVKVAAGVGVYVGTTA